MGNALFANTPSGKSTCLLVLFAFGCALYLIQLGAWDLWPADEPRFGQVEREMLKSGDWMVPHVNDKVYIDKPPLFFWAGSAFALLNGGNVTSLTTRLPSALSGIAGLLIAFLIGERLFNRRAAFLGALALGIAQIFIDQARTAQTDMIMAVFAYAALGVFVSAWFGGKLRPLPAAAWFGILAGLAVLGKGPVGVIVPVGSIALFVALSREWKRVHRGAVLLAAFCFAVVVFSWLIPMVHSIPRRDSQELLWTQNVIRYLSATHHRNPPWFFLEYLPVNFLPMTLFLPAVALMLWREKRAGRPMSSQRLFLLSWFVFTFVFFSLSAGKREQYILPLYPALALLVGDWMDRRLEASPDPGRGFTWVARILGTLLVVAGSGALFAGPPVLASQADSILGGPIPPEWFSFPSIAAGLALAGAAMLAGTRGRNLTRLFYGVVAGTALVWLTIFLFVYPPLNQRKSGWALCETINREWSPGEPVLGYKLYRSQYHLYSDYYIDEVDSLDPVIRAFEGPGQAFCLMRDNRHYERFVSAATDRGLSWRILWREAIGHRDVIVVTDTPLPSKPLDAAQGVGLE
ncbi:glycosyltransferase family 39 protein [Candidatus Sumerlaeota bacterium]|nr:glycosyltransferase family 39 protein [Candidatus Sumerlaeota bacterium]